MGSAESEGSLGRQHKQTDPHPVHSLHPMFLPGMTWGHVMLALIT